MRIGKFHGGQSAKVVGLLLLSLLCILPAPAQAQHAEDEALGSSGYRPVYPLKVSANHRYLVDQNDQPFLIVGDSPQGLMGNLSEQDMDKYFADRAAHGFNTAGWIDVSCAGRDYPENKTGSTADGILPFSAYIKGGYDHNHYDLSSPNNTYFTRLDRVIRSAAAHNIFVFIDPVETAGWLQTLRDNGLAAAYAYGRYLGQRYKRYKNVGWISGNDFNRWRIPDDDALALAVAKGIKSVAPEQIQTVELNYQTSSSLDDRRWTPIISLNATYTYSATYIQMLHSYNQRPTMPTFLVEGHYDLEQVGDPIDYGTPDVLRRQEYWTMLSGGIGQFYGNHYTWSLVSGWNSYMDTVAVSQVGIWKKFFTSLPWQDLVPDQHHETVTDGYGVFGDSKVHLDAKSLSTMMTPRVSLSNYATASRVPDGSCVVVYMPSAGTVTVEMSRLRGPVRAEWFDPTAGTYEVISGSPFANHGTRQFASPGRNDAGDGDLVLLLRSTNSN